METALQCNLNRIGNHHISFASQELLKNRAIIWKNNDISLFNMSFDKPLVSAT